MIREKIKYYVIITAWLDIEMCVWSGLNMSANLHDGKEE